MVQDHVTHHPRFLNTKFGDQDAYATNDLMVPLEGKPGFWKVIGRVDDQIVLSNGEKVILIRFCTDSADQEIRQILFL